MLWVFMFCGSQRQLKEIPVYDFLWKSFPVPGRGSPDEFCAQRGPFCTFPQCRGSGNQPECCENPIQCEIHRIGDKIQLFSRKGHTLAIHKTHKKPNHKYLHPCLLEPKPWQWLEAAPAQIRARIPAAIPTLHQHPVGAGSKATTPRIKQQP